MRRLGLCFVFLLLFCPVHAEEQGFNSLGDTLPIGAGETPALKLFKKQGSESGGRVLIGSGTVARARLDVDGGLRIGTDEQMNLVNGTPTTCPAAKNKTLSYVGGVLYQCDGTQGRWVAFPAQ